MADQRIFKEKTYESKEKPAWSRGWDGRSDQPAPLGRTTRDHARLSLAELGRRVGLSAPAVAERLQRLEETGVVSGYRAEVDPRALGYTLSAVIRIRPAAQQLQKVADLARRTPEVVECHRITGEDCFLLKLHLRDMQHLEQLVDRFTPLGQTTTSLIQSSPVPVRSVTVENGASEPGSGSSGLSRRVRADGRGRMPR
jgi:Lrp/AsnC family leucine-responsive transcriptional regulator